MCARANRFVSAAATSGKRSVLMIVGVVGQTILTTAGKSARSTSSTFSSSWLIWLDARGVVDDGFTVPPWGIEVPGSAHYANRDRLCVGAAYLAVLVTALHVCCTRFHPMMRNGALTRSDSGAPGRIRTCLLGAIALRV